MITESDFLTLLERYKELETQARELAMKFLQAEGAGYTSVGSISIDKEFIKFSAIPCTSGMYACRAIPTKHLFQEDFNVYEYVKLKKEELESKRKTRAAEILQLEAKINTDVSRLKELKNRQSTATLENPDGTPHQFHFFGDYPYPSPLIQL